MKLLSWVYGLIALVAGLFASYSVTTVAGFGGAGALIAVSALASATLKPEPQSTAGWFVGVAAGLAIGLAAHNVAQVP